MALTRKEVVEIRARAIRDRYFWLKRKLDLLRRNITIFWPRDIKRFLCKHDWEIDYYWGKDFPTKDCSKCGDSLGFVERRDVKGIKVKKD